MTTATREIAFIDAAIADWETLLAGLNEGTEVVLLDSSSDGLLQIANSLRGSSDVSAIHVFSHGRSGELVLGDAVVNSVNLEQYGEALATIGSALSETGDILLYGCNVAQGDCGQAFIAQLAAATGADVAASTDLTGSAVLGGDWVLEASVGEIRSQNAFSLLEAYESLLGQGFTEVPIYQYGLNSNPLKQVGVAVFRGRNLPVDQLTPDNLVCIASAYDWRDIDQDGRVTPADWIARQLAAFVSLEGAKRSVLLSAATSELMNLTSNPEWYSLKEKVFFDAAANTIGDIAEKTSDLIKDYIGNALEFGERVDTTGIDVVYVDDVYGYTSTSAVDQVVSVVNPEGHVAPEFDRKTRK